MAKRTTPLSQAGHGVCRSLCLSVNAFGLALIVAQTAKQGSPSFQDFNRGVILSKSFLNQMSLVSN